MFMALEKWFFIEATHCFNRFADYLDFSHWKVGGLARFVNHNAA